MKYPFIKQPLIEHWLQKLFKNYPKKNALIELNNSLAESPDPAFSKADFDQLCERYKINLREKYEEKITEMYKKFFTYWLYQHSQFDKNLEPAHRLLDIFGISKTQADIIHSRAAEDVYRDIVTLTIDDGILNDDKEEALEEKRELLQLNKSQAQEVLDSCRINRVNQFVEQIIEDGRVSPQEEIHLEEISRCLNVDLTFDSDTQALYDKYRFLWRIENEDLPRIEPDIILQKREVCYLKQYTKWHEYRAQTKRVNYGGPTMRIRIAKGLYYRAGSLNVQRVSEEVLKLIDVGMIYITNKRLIFAGEKKNTNIRFSRIIDFKGYSNGVDIIKDAGKSPFLELSEDADLFLAVLSRAISDSLTE